jgi:hypothetical protein
MATKKNKDDILEMILEDHRALKKLIKVMKDTDAEESERRSAFEEFAPLLVTHAKPEEQTWYTYMKENHEDLRTEAFEGDVEHGLADQMLEEIKRTKDQDQWSARVKVLAELVEHHIEEEEDELIPDFREQSVLEERIALGEAFMEAKENVKADGTEVNPAFKPTEEETQARH